MKKCNNIQRFASNNVIQSGCKLGRCVVVVANDTVIDIHPLRGEEPFTKWIPDKIEIYQESNGILRIGTDDVL